MPGRGPRPTDVARLARVLQPERGRRSRSQAAGTERRRVPPVPDRCNGRITVDAVLTLADEDRSEHRGSGGANLSTADSGSPSCGARDWASLEPKDFLDAVFDPAIWTDDASPVAEDAGEELRLLHDKAIETLGAAPLDELVVTSATHPLVRVVRDLRYRVATRGPFESTEGIPIQITTLWGAKGLTAEHVYVVGLCDEALPGERADEYPGDDADFVDEQRRLFYVSITRPTRTLALSRPTRVRFGESRRLGLPPGVVEAGSGSTSERAGSSNRSSARCQRRWRGTSGRECRHRATRTTRTSEPSTTSRANCFELNGLGVGAAR